MRNMVLLIDTNVLLNYIITCNVKDFVHGDSVGMAYTLTGTLALY